MFRIWKTNMLMIQSECRRPSSPPNYLGNATDAAKPKSDAEQKKRKENDEEAPRYVKLKGWEWLLRSMPATRGPLVA